VTALTTRDHTAGDFEVDQPVWIHAYGTWYPGNVTAVISPIIVVTFTTRTGGICHRSINPEREAPRLPLAGTRGNRHMRGTPWERGPLVLPRDGRHWRAARSA
jgi:hypothetical protein